MKDSKPMIVPFGKYRGQPVEVLARDKQYLDWILSQDGIRQKYPQFINVIVNNFQEPSETPEHNYLQVKFLSREYREKFLRYIAPPLEKKEWLMEKEVIIHRIEEVIANSRGYGRDDEEKKICLILQQLKEKADIDIYEKYLKFHFEYGCYSHLNDEDRKKEIGQKRRELDPLFEKTIEFILKEFESDVDSRIQYKDRAGDPLLEEKGIDVIFRGWFCFVSGQNKIYQLFLKSPSYYNLFMIEIKPTVSDDFPAVMRQMKLNDSNILFLSEYTGRGATKEEFIEFFKSQGKRVVFECDIK